MRCGCGSCEDSRTRMYDLHAHQSLHGHSGLQYVCDDCNARYDTEVQFDRHLISIHRIPSSLFAVKIVRVLVSEILYLRKDKLLNERYLDRLLPMSGDKLS
jgi:hypothetical protein